MKPIAGRIFHKDIIAILCLLLFTLLLNLSGAMGYLEGRVFDFFLGLRPSIPESEKIVLVNFDDKAIEAAGTWPVGRNVIADGLMLMAEAGAAMAVFDIEYVDKSPRGINGEYLDNDVPRVFDREFSQVQANLEAFVEALQAGKISLRDSGDYLAMLQEGTRQNQQNLMDKIRLISRDNDEYLAGAIRLFGNAYMTVNMQDRSQGDLDPAMAELARSLAVKNLTVHQSPVKQARSILPAIYPVLAAGRGAGFPNVFPDEDGVRRHVDILYEYAGSYYAQLAFAPLLDLLGNPALELYGDALVLKDARYPDGSVHTVRIPLNFDGLMVINWPRKTFDQSFSHITFFQLIEHDRLMRDLVGNLKARVDWGYPRLDEFVARHEALEEQRQVLMAEVHSGEAHRAALAAWAGDRNAWCAEVGEYFAGSTSAELLAWVEGEIAAGGNQGDLKALQEDIPQYYVKTATLVTELLAIRKDLASRLGGRYCIIGNTGTGTTDIGVTPFDSTYMNVGTHGAVMNTILQRSFLLDTPWYIGMLIATLVCFLVVSLVRRMSSLQAILSGGGAFVGVIGLSALLFVLTGIYVPVLTPAIAILLTFITVTLIKFQGAEKEKGALRTAFSHYLSTDVIKEILDDPTKLKLGGEERHMTAVFTDVKGFSTISEQLSAPDLVRLLNEYLTGMSDIILDHQGTIDKYEGDAIISFFGAPVTLQDHAHRACESAVRMKLMEEELNRRFLGDRMSPTPLHTRIGINTGSMVVGNMGTVKKMDYTIMGNSVNLASRLEGVNKVYGTWIMASEWTWQECRQDAFTFRELDRVRVVGINTPVRLYDVIGFADQASDNLKRGLELYAKGLGLFEKRNWKEAADCFRRVYEFLPDDPPSTLYLGRCQEYLKTPPKPDWDGVFTMSSK